MGNKAIKEVKMAVFIASDLVLLKIRSYWCIIDTTGQIREIANDLRNALYLRPYTLMSSRRLPMINGMILLLQHSTLTMTI